jgi:hypothetical protein
MPFTDDKFKASLAAVRRALNEEKEKELGIAKLKTKAAPLLPSSILHVTHCCHCRCVMLVSAPNLTDVMLCSGKERKRSQERIIINNSSSNGYFNR